MARTGSCWLEGRPQGHALSSLVNRKAGVGVPRWVHSAPATASPPVPHSVQRTHCAPSPLQALLARRCPGAAPSLKALGMWGVHCAMAGGTGVGRAASSLVLQEELPCYKCCAPWGSLAGKSSVLLQARQSSPSPLLPCKASCPSRALGTMSPRGPALAGGRPPYLDSSVWREHVASRSTSRPCRLASKDRRQSEAGEGLASTPGGAGRGGETQQGHTVPTTQKTKAQT